MYIYNTILHAYAIGKIIIIFSDNYLSLYIDIYKKYIPQPRIIFLLRKVTLIPQ